MDDADALTQLRADQAVLSKLAPYARSHSDAVRCHQLLQRLEQDISVFIHEQVALLMKEAGLRSRTVVSSIRRCSSSHRSVCN
jgi:hypothetical protein